MRRSEGRLLLSSERNGAWRSPPASSNIARQLRGVPQLRRVSAETAWSKHGLPELLRNHGHVNQMAHDRMILIRPGRFGELGPERQEEVHALSPRALSPSGVLLDKRTNSHHNANLHEEKIDQVRILMGDEVSKRTKAAFAEGLRHIKARLDNSLEAEKEKNDFRRPWE